MPLGGKITALLFADFQFENDNGLLTPQQNGPFTLPANATATLDPNAAAFPIRVDDDDELFEDGFQENDGDQTLEEAVSTTDTNGNPVNLPVGTFLEVEFTLRATTPSGEIIDLLFVAAGPGENQGDLFFVVSTAPIPPGVTLDIEFLNDGGGTPYEDIICFAAGTKIDTPDGPKAVETLAPGDPVSIFGGGSAEVVWIGRRHVSVASQQARRALRPVRIRKDAFGPGAPFADLYVSQQHCILLQSAHAEIMFGEPQVLAPAISLCNDENIRIDDAVRDVEYFHLMLSDHHILTANGLAAESFYPGPSALRTLTPAARDEFEVLFPEFAQGDFGLPAHRVLKRFEAQAYLKRQ